ncbi:ABC transporter permease [Pseudonocardia tropica]|uniref:ABC transporter permease n=1 Tax=Pseudonocardia tropica TaxID=681289 RepID=A0ABV1JSZ3_9PSEU
MTVTAPTGLVPAPAPAARPGVPRRPHPLSALRRGRGLVGTVLVGVVVLAGLAAPLLAPYDPLAQIPGANLLPASATHWLGTDEVNRDVFSRTLYGILANLGIIAVAVPLGAVTGALVGLVSSLSAAVDVVAQRVFDVLLAFPVLILGIALAAVLGPGATTVVVVIVAAEIPIFGRLLRGAALRVRETPYVEAATVVGAGRWWVLRRHVLPNAAEPAGVQVAVSLSVAVFVESAMSFIGIGVRPPDPSLGSIVADSVQYLDVNPAMALGPLVVITTLTLGFLLVAQALAAGRRVAG